MAKLFPSFVKKRRIIVQQGGDSSEVLREALRYDLPERVTPQTVRDAIFTAAREQLGPLSEEVVAALLAFAHEEAATLLDAARLTVAPLPDAMPTAIAWQSLGIQAAEVAPTPQDLTQAAILVTGEAAPVPAEAIRTTAGITAAEAAPDLADTVASAIVARQEAVPAPQDQPRLSLLLSDNVPTPSVAESAQPIATAAEPLPTVEDAIAATIVAQSDNPAPPGDAIVLEAALTGYANQNVSTTTWATPANALGNTPAVAATLTATSSGLLGTTNNTATGIITLGFRDVNLGDLAISSAILSVETQHANAGVPLTQPTCTVQYQYSLDNGGTWALLYAQAANTAKAIQTLDVTAIVGQNQALLSALQIRATGSVTSGTGRGAGSTASFFRAWMTVLATRSLP